MPAGLTAKQAELAAYLREHVRDHGYPPSRREMAGRFGWSSANAASCHLKALVRKGVIELPPGNKARAIRLLDAAAALKGVGCQ